MTTMRKGNAAKSIKQSINDYSINEQNDLSHAQNSKHLKIAVKN